MAALQDIFAEINAVSLWQQRNRDADNAAASFSPRQLRNMSLVTARYPDIRPGPLLALAYGKYPASHPLVQQVGEASAALELREHPAGVQTGDPGVNRNMLRTQTEFQRDAQRARNQPRHFPTPTDPALKAVWEQANAAGLIIDGGLLKEPGGDPDSPAQYVYRQVRDAYLAANEPMPVITEEGRPVVITRGSPLTSGGWATKVEPLGEEPERDRGPSVGRGGINLGVQRAGISGTAALNAGVRTAFMGLDAPVQEIQGQVRNLYGLTQGRSPNFLEPQSDLGVWLGSNQELDPGSGYFVDPESELAAARRAREETRGQIGGHNVTAGRWLANSVGLDPDTKPFQLMSGIADLSVQIADPSGWGLGQAGKGIQASRLFAAVDPEDASFLVRGLRSVVKPADAQQWLDGSDGIRAVEWLTDTHSPAEVWRAMNYKVDLDTATRLADTRSVAETRSVIEPMLGSRIREVATATIGEGVASTDPLKLMPSRAPIRMAARDQVAFQVESFLANAKAEPGFAAPLIDKVARAQTPVEVNAAVRDALRATDGLLQQAGIEDKGLRELATGLHENTHEAVHLTQRAALTNQGPSTAPLMIAGQATDVLEPVLLSELAPEFLSLPDARVIRRMVSDMPNIMKRGLYTDQYDLRRGYSAVEAIQNQLWKPLQLMRAAWTVRVVGEEQIRMAAAGYDSMFNHPLSYISWGAGRRGRGKADSWLHPIAMAGDVKGRRGQTDVFGTLIEDANDYTDSLAQTHAGWLDKAVMPTSVKTTFAKGDPRRYDEYLQAWGSEILKLHGNNVSRRVAEAPSLDDVVDWFTRGAGNFDRGQLATAYPGKFDDLDQARGYLEGVQNRIHYMTGGDAELMEAVRTGRLRGEQLLDGTSINPKIRPVLEQKLDGFGPDTMLGEDVVRYRDEGLVGLARWVQDRAVQSLFGVLMTQRTNNLSRSRVFKQAYWREAERLIGFADEATKAQVVQAAKDANLGSRAVRRMERAKPSGRGLTLEELDFLAKGHGLDETRTLLYDLSQKGRFMDAARLVFPFGEAWKEVLTRWLGDLSMSGGRLRYNPGLVAQNPKTIRRAQQLIQGARGEEFGDFMGAPDGEGFFWKNEFGEEVFIYPGSGILTDKLLGVEIPLTGSLEGMSMFGTVIPGLGPTVQMPTAWILKTKPGPQWMREFWSAVETAKVPEGIPVVGGTTAREQILPFGSPSESDMGEAANVLNYLPTWARTAANFITNGDGNEAQWGNAVNSVAAYLSTTGSYGTSIEERQRLMEDAAWKAREFMFIKALAQGTAPSAPQEDWRLVDRDDQSVRVRALAEEYRALQEQDFDSADREFLDRYGVNILAAIQSDTAGIEYSVPTTREGVAWVIANPGVDEMLPHTYGFFAPKGGDFDYTLYAEQFRQGQRARLTTEQWTRLMNTTRGDLVYEDAKKEVGDDADTVDGRRFLRETRDWIRQQYDGWGDTTGIPGRPETDTLIPELYRAIDNDTVMATDAGQGLALYLQGRDEVVADADSRGVTLSAQEMADGREYLRGLGDWVIGQHPGFKDVFDIVLSRELDED